MVFPWMGGGGGGGGGGLVSVGKVFKPIHRKVLFKLCTEV